MSIQTNVPEVRMTLVEGTLTSSGDGQYDLAVVEADGSVTRMSVTRDILSAFEGEEVRLVVVALKDVAELEGLVLQSAPAVPAE